MCDIVSDTSENVRKTLDNANGLTDIERMRKTFITGGLSGLCNMGNTCYMNAALQCLSATDLLASYIRGENPTEDSPFKGDLYYNIQRSMMAEARKKYKDEKDIKIDVSDIRKKYKSTLTYKLRNIFVLMWGENCKVKPIEFKSMLGDLKNIFQGRDQNDSQECLSFILDQIHEEVKSDVITRFKNLSPELIHFKEEYDKYMKLFNETENTTEKLKYKSQFNEFRLKHVGDEAMFKSLSFWRAFMRKNHSAILDIFTGLSLTQVQCNNCQSISFNFEPFNLLSLPIMSGTDLTLDMCLQEYFNNDEILTGDNQYQCDSCSGKHDAKKFTKLWHTPERLIIQLKRFVNFGHRVTKNQSNINFPITELNIGKYISQYVTDDDSIYDLYGVIHHSGSLGGGHYVAYTKNILNKQWYLFDDQHVVHIDEQSVENRIVNSGAYVLFYAKSGNFSIVEPLVEPIEPSTGSDNSCDGISKQIV